MFPGSAGSGGEVVCMVLRCPATQPSRQSGTGQGAVTSTRLARAARRNPTTVRACLPGR